jgi:hypothetical protein
MKTGNIQGYHAIGIYRHKTEHNIGTLWRLIELDDRVC